ncbi:type VI secretion system lipoprotein TssJ [Marinomonas posidonica]|uniref:Type VI secretion lipoprotein, VC_A0113 family n=1 Tax=Marinomonas posidonica (strain CECT 7376 / NCIMB 14433 / IVIA-Po-181) TaxID=491952 RepID=F6D0Z7_MARPP|nr:type VI secretion system lipoprotein TssJ [Marinomonas posidonica]AEF53720.1 type VI secretion lipoprotein, VC_A0113 family [Marinomonas posidonica IVIA-Po-181]
MKLKCFKSVLCYIWIVILVGCSSSGSSPTFLPPFKVEVNIIPAEDINVYSDGSPHPVAIRVYQLREIGAFTKSEFLELYNQDRSVLNEALVDMINISPVLPGKTQKLTLDIQQEARYLAVLAEFANYRQLVTKSYISLADDPDENPVYIRITSTEIDIKQPVDDSWW